jgi:hypothetical protein
MNMITREIMARFGLDAKDALEVQKIVDSYYPIDYSEAEQSEHDLAYDLAFAHWKNNGEISEEEIAKIVLAAWEKQKEAKVPTATTKEWSHV